MARHYESRILIDAPAEDIFAHIDDHARLSAHMNKSSPMIGGGRMTTSIDEGNGQKVGSHIQMSGRVVGVTLFLDEVVTRREPPRLKVWKTVGNLKLLVIGHYEMGFELEPQGKQSWLRVYIDYDLPTKSAWLGRLLGGTYARWCVQQMIRDTYDHFTAKAAK